MVVLPAQAEPLSSSAAPIRRLRTAALGAAAVVLVVEFVPPVGTWSHRYEFVETIQFALAAFALPALLVGAWPLELLGGGRGARILPGLGRLAEARQRHPWPVRSFLSAAAFVGVGIAWRTPALMDALARHAWLAPVEVVTLAVVGVLLWTEIVSFPPFQPRTSPLWRAAVAAASMWGVWIMAYLVGFSHSAWYTAFHHAGGLSATADQELSTAVMWFAAACAFVPLVFVNLLRWLRNGEDPDAELRAIVRRERRFGDWGRRP